MVQARAPHLIARRLRFTPTAMLYAVQGATYDVPLDREHPTELRVPTFLEFDRLRRTEISDDLGINRFSTYQALPDEGLRQTYGDYVAGRFDAGGTIPDRVWKMYSPQLRRKIASTARGRRNGLKSVHLSAHAKPVAPKRESFQQVVA